MTVSSLWIADCLTAMRDMPKHCVDIVYLDPPFNSDRVYSGTDAASGAGFSDIWTSDDISRDARDFLSGENPVAYAIAQNAEKSFGHSMRNYLIFMALRLVEMRRLLRPAGSLYLHCDPTSSHYLKLTLDAIFGVRQFRNEIIWCYSRPSSPGQRQLSRVHDVIYWYSRGDRWTFNPHAIRQPYAESSLEREGYASSNEWKIRKGYVHLTDGGKFPESWIYISPVKGNSEEFTGYPTQKPMKILERIVLGGSAQGDTLLDPFCGSGTSLVVAERLGRHWIGIDRSEQAIQIAKSRLEREGRLLTGEINIGRIR